MLLTTSVFLTAAAIASPATESNVGGAPYRVHALVGARVVIAPGRAIGPATVVIRDGIIDAVGADLAPPADALRWDLTGKTVHAGFIDAYVPAARLASHESDDEEDDARPVVHDATVATPKPPGASHDLAWVTPEREVAAALVLAPKAVRRYRDLGFVAAHVVPSDGVFRGISAVTSLGDGTPNRELLRERSATVVGFEERRNEYPNSLMGLVALIRQTLFDAAWYRQARRAYTARPRGRERPPLSRALAALDPAVTGAMPVLFDCRDDPLNLLRAGAIAAEHGLAPIYLGTGAEYRRLDEIRALRAPVIATLDFPAAPVVDHVAEWVLVPTERLRHWYRAPANPRWLIEAGVEVALTTHRLKEPKTWRARLDRARAAGLDDDDALAALTTVPARLLGLGDVLGTVEPGKAASLVVGDGPPLAAATRIESVWVDGRRYPVKAAADGAGGQAEPWSDGDWLVTVTRSPFHHVDLVVSVATRAGETRASYFRRGKLPVHHAACATADRADRLLLVVDAAELGLGRRRGPAQLVAWRDGDALTGFVDFAGVSLPVRGARFGSTEELTPAVAVERGPPPKPPGGPLLHPDAVLVRDAELWTQGPRGRFRGDLYIDGGEIRALGPRLDAAWQALEIDAAGRHVTPGLIDAHYHQAVTGSTNESTAAATAQVRVGDALNSEDRRLYTHLAGGLTTALVLHGSANPVGGQSETIKLRWGSPPDGLRFGGAVPGLKLALGENVKQSNWGDRFVKRYPQTRLGVEQIIRERLLAAVDYQRRWDDYRSLQAREPDAIPPRRDLQLEALAEVVRGRRLVHCHAYRQDEILMLLRLMREFGVTVATLQHGSEAYKAAAELAAAGVGVSVFSDWWGYKHEVGDGIPTNAALLWLRGVVVSLNSDSADVARRLNTEATKAVRYGGLDAQAALDLVTRNPARQLRIDHRVGSLEPGKDADFVLWSGNPLNPASVVEQTWLDGAKYFDRGVDALAQRQLVQERRRLIDRAERSARASP